MSSSKYTVSVRIKVVGSKHAVTGYSSYSGQSYEKHYKNAVLNACYIDASNRHKKFNSDSPVPRYQYIDSSILYVGKEKKHAKRGVNRKLNTDIRENSEKRQEQLKKDKKKHDLDRPISRKKQQQEIGFKKESKGGKHMQSKEHKIKILEERIKQEQIELKRLKKSRS